MAALGLCAYDPANPAFSYFGIGEAAAALAFTLAVPQFIKPIYRMRLVARRIRILYIFTLAFVGAGFVLIGALLPHLPIQRDFLLAYPVVWELLGGALFAVAYGLLAFGSVLPLRARPGRVRNFAQAVVHFLTLAQPADHVEFAEHELAANFVRLTKFANFVDRFEEPSAFFDFTHRSQVEDGEYAQSLLMITSDHRLCRTMVERTPWLAAHLIRLIDQEKIQCPAAERLIQEIALQAIVSNDSMLAREAGFGGFSTAPVLAEALFSSAFLAENYRPLHWLSIGFDEPITQPLVKRFNMAAKMLLNTSLNQRNFWQSSAHYDVADIYKRMFTSLRSTPVDGIRIDVLIALTSGANERAQQIRTTLESLPSKYRRKLYKENDQHRRRDNIIEVYANMANDLLESIANDFQGIDDRFWSFAIGLWHDTFPFHQNETAGLDPFQQRLALHLKAKVTDNMQGWYPAITRLILAVQGPHGGPPIIERRSAYVILGDLFYDQLRTGLPKLAKDMPDKLSDYLPPSVTYDLASNTLTRTYIRGNQRQTDLNALQIGLVDLYDQRTWLEPDQAV